MRSMRPLPHFLLRRVTIFGGDAGSARASAPPGVVAFGRRECRTSRQLEDRRSGGPLFLAAVRLVGPLRGLPSGAPSIRYQSRTSFRLPAPRRDRTAKSVLIKDSVDAPYGLTRQHSSAEASWSPFHGVANEQVLKHTKYKGVDEEARADDNHGRRNIQAIVTCFAGEHVQLSYEKKGAQLRTQDANGVEPFAIETTRAATRDLQTKLNISAAFVDDVS
ncbi:hypothetical protein VPH35_050366 [Triticum aestivum]|uniref:DUF632 domain-containing protein n=2 Tax=Triticum TaxID=4564 RepID=A0A9R1Q9Y3_TRITD|nr:unnamed protein product [Triticum aestivum]VAH73462.1 unnamed protein product [Triticum turgidum subsp. durum]